MLHAHLSYRPCFGHPNYHKPAQHIPLGSAPREFYFSLFTGKHYWTLNNKEHDFYLQNKIKLNFLKKLKTELYFKDKKIHT